MDHPEMTPKTNREYLVLLYHDQQAVHRKLDRIQADIEELKTTQTQARTLAGIALPAALAALAAWLKQVFHA